MEKYPLFLLPAMLEVQKDFIHLWLKFRKKDGIKELFEEEKVRLPEPWEQPQTKDKRDKTSLQ